MTPRAGRALELSARRALSIGMSVALAVLPTLICIQEARAFQTASSSNAIVIGVVVLSELPAGQETSGSAVTNPAKYQEVPGLVVVLAEMPKPQQPATADPAAATLEGVVVDVGDGRKQPANQPLTWVPPLGNAFATVSVLLRDKPDQPIATAHVPIDQTAPPPPTGAPKPGLDTPTNPQPPRLSSQPAPGTATPVSSVYTMPPVATAGAVHVIHGDSSGNSNDMKITVDDKPANIVAAKPGTVFWEIPQTLTPGLHHVVFSPGPRRSPVMLPLYILALQMSADQTNLIRGQSTRMHVAVTGLDNLPASVWQQSEAPPADLVDLKKLEKHATNLRLPKPGEPGTVILVLDNQSPETVRMGNRGAQIVLVLHQQDFAKGPYRYEDKLQSIKSGGFGIQGAVTAFLKQATGQPAVPGAE